jgi:hypothetical protein
MTMTFSATCPDPSHRLFALLGDRLPEGEVRQALGDGDRWQLGHLLAHAVLDLPRRQQRGAVKLMAEAGYCNANAVREHRRFLRTLLEASRPSDD